MERPTTRQLRAYWDSLPDQSYTCSWCGRTGSRSQLQPQHPYYATVLADLIGGPTHRPASQAVDAACDQCHNRGYYEAQRRRKAQLAATPRCEIPGCTARATFTADEQVGMCGRHLHRAQASHIRGVAGLPGGMGLFATVHYSRSQLIELAQA